MDAVAWTLIGTGAAILIAIAGAFRALRNEILEQRRELGEHVTRTVMARLGITCHRPGSASRIVATLPVAESNKPKRTAACSVR